MVDLYLPALELEGILEHWVQQKPGFLAHLEKLYIVTPQYAPSSPTSASRISTLIQTFLSPRVPTLLNKRLPFRKLLICRSFDQPWFEKHVSHVMRRFD